MPKLLLALLAFLVWPAEASSVLEAAWTSIAFDSESGYHIEIDTDATRHISRMVVRHGEKVIPIPPSAYAEIYYPSLRDTQFLDYRGGSFGLEVKEFIFPKDGRGRADEKRIWAFVFEGDSFKGVSSHVEPVDEQGE